MVDKIEASHQSALIIHDENGDFLSLIFHTLAASLQEIEHIVVVSFAMVQVLKREIIVMLRRGKEPIILNACSLLFVQGFQYQKDRP